MGYLSGGVESREYIPEDKRVKGIESAQLTSLIELNERRLSNLVGTIDLLQCDIQDIQWLVEFAHACEIRGRLSVGCISENDKEDLAML